MEELQIRMGKVCAIVQSLAYSSVTLPSPSVWLIQMRASEESRTRLGFCSLLAFCLPHVEPERS